MVRFFLFIRGLRRKGKQIEVMHVVCGNLLVTLFLLSVLFLVLEVGLRYWWDNTDAMMSTRASIRWFEEHWQTNGSGFRDTVEYEKTRSPGKEQRITFLGDSFTAGHGIPDVRDCFPCIIRAEREDWEIHTLAIPGWDTPDELGILRRAAEDGYELDTVALVYFFNDIVAQAPEIQEKITAASSRVTPRNAFVRHSFLLDRLVVQARSSRAPVLRNYFLDVAGLYEGETMQKQEAVLLQLRDAVRTNGGRLVVITFPLLHALDNEGAQSAHAILAAFFRRHDIPHLDLLPVFQEHAGENLTLNALDAHPNERAHAIAARHISAFLSKCTGSEE